MDSYLIKLPTVTMLEAARAGSRTGVDLNGVESPLTLPTVSSTGIVLSGEMFYTSKNLMPTITEWNPWDLRFGQHFEGKLPPIEIDAEFFKEFFLVVESTLPGIECEAEIILPTYLRLDASLPALTIDATTLIDRLYSLDRKLPVPILEAFSYGGYTALDAVLPPIRMLPGDSAATSGDILTLDATLPTVVMQPVGAGGVPDGQAGVLMDETRFDDYVLRYSRTA
jgi:hypothetical protein